MFTRHDSLEMAVLGIVLVFAALPGMYGYIPFRQMTLESLHFFERAWIGLSAERIHHTISRAGVIAGIAFTLLGIVLTLSG